jgi:hypothetical protein
MSAKMDELIARHADKIAEHGLALQGVFATESSPQFIYTIGLTELAHPEILLYGLPFEIGAGLLNDLGRRVKAGERFEGGTSDEEVLVGFPVVFLTATDRREFTMVRRFYGPDHHYDAVQLCWPDAAGLFPWQDGANPNCRYPLLGEPPA